MKFFSLFVVGVVALSFSACEQQPFSKLELMESPFHHDHSEAGHAGHEKAAPAKDEAKTEVKSEKEAAPAH